MLHFELDSVENPGTDRLEFVGNSEYHAYIKGGEFLFLLQYCGEDELYWYFENYGLTGNRTCFNFRKTKWKKTFLVFALEDSLN